MDLGRILIEEAAIAPPAHVALVGAGGKTTTMLALLAAGIARSWRCLGATTTRVGTDQIPHGVPFRFDHQQGDKLVGVTPQSLDEEFAGGAIDLLVVEADGARGKVVKAPADHEPVLPASATHVVAIIGADALDRVIEDVAHRPMRVAAVCGCSPYSCLTVERAAVLLTSTRGSRKDVPDSARFVVAVTRVGPRQRSAVDRLAEALTGLGVTTVELPAPDYSRAT